MLDFEKYLSQETPNIFLARNAELKTEELLEEIKSSEHLDDEDIILIGILKSKISLRDSSMMYNYDNYCRKKLDDATEYVAWYIGKSIKQLNDCSLCRMKISKYKYINGPAVSADKEKMELENELVYRDIVLRAVIEDKNCVKKYAKLIEEDAKKIKGVISIAIMAWKEASIYKYALQLKMAESSAEQGINYILIKEKEDEMKRIEKMSSLVVSFFKLIENLDKEIIKKYNILTNDIYARIIKKEKETISLMQLILSNSAKKCRKNEYQKTELKKLNNGFEIEPEYYLKEEADESITCCYLSDVNSLISKKALIMISNEIKLLCPDISTKEWRELIEIE